ncbi:SDR family oxidoreductase, partial [Nocardia miyunensis]|uniref:SDR family oxidoreductase n=1 Tax=Nocardia miyunensis TaxID=282684 RepID=UPI0012F52634
MRQRVGDAAHCSRRGGRGGSVVITSSLATVLAHENTAHYAAAKAGLVSLMKVMAKKLAPQNIRVRREVRHGHNPVDRCRGSSLTRAHTPGRIGRVRSMACRFGRDRQALRCKAFGLLAGLRPDIRGPGHRRIAIVRCAAAHRKPMLFSGSPFGACAASIPSGTGYRRGGCRGFAEEPAAAANRIPPVWRPFVLVRNRPTVLEYRTATGHMLAAVNDRSPRRGASQTGCGEADRQAQCRGGEGYYMSRRRFGVALVCAVGVVGLSAVPAV